MGASMRGSDATSGSLFSYVDLEQRVPAAHPLRTIRTIVNDVLVSLDAEFERASRLPRSGCLGPLCFRPSTRFAPSAS
jgi:hypothetical protein